MSFKTLLSPAFFSSPSRPVAAAAAMAFSLALMGAALHAGHARAQVPAGPAAPEAAASAPVQPASPPAAAAPAAPAAPAASAPRYTAAEVAQMFGYIDRNKDGVISREEASGFRGVARHFDEADTNKDNMLSRDEFEKAMNQVK